MAGTLDHVEDAVECLAKHESGFILVAVSGNEREAVAFSNNITSIDNLEWLQRRFNEYCETLRAKLE